MCLGCKEDIPNYIWNRAKTELDLSGFITEYGREYRNPFRRSSSFQNISIPIKYEHRSKYSRYPALNKPPWVQPHQRTIRVEEIPQSPSRLILYGDLMIKPKLYSTSKVRSHKTAPDGDLKLEGLLEVARKEKYPRITTEYRREYQNPYKDSAQQPRIIKTTLQVKVLSQP